MLLENKRALERFAHKQAISRVPLAEWMQKVEAAEWSNLVEVKKTFNSADYVKPFVVFNVGGNNYRIVAEVIFAIKTVRIAKVGTHKEYDGWKL